MYKILLDRIADQKLKLHVLSRSKNKDVPMHWFEVISNIKLFNIKSTHPNFSFKYLFTNNTFLFAHHISASVIFAALCKRPLIYLCWGVPIRSKFKNLIMRFIFLRATFLLVNDAVTLKEIKKIACRTAKIIPFFVDADYFNFTPLANRQNFLFCNGSNDRDPNLLLGLANKGFKIIWLVNDHNLYECFKNTHPNLILKSNISFSNLKVLYQTCKMYLLPATRDAHCAGQTTSMEAICSGAPVLISNGRTASIFLELESVLIIENQDIEEWARVIQETESDALMSFKVEASSFALRAKISTDNIKKELSLALGLHAI